MTRSSTEIAVGARVAVRIERLAAGGDGVARIDGCVVFVPASAPGDELLVEIVERARKHLRARIVEIRTASPARREPRCAHFGECGGCAWQHVEPATQRAAKAAIVRAALEHLAGIQCATPVEIRAAGEYGYRARAELFIEPGRGTGRRVGYRRWNSRVLEPVSECPVLLEELQAELRALTAHPERIPASAASVHLAAGEEGAMRTFLDARERAVGAGPEAATVVQSIGGLRYAFDARGFFQANAALVAELVGVAVGGARGRLVLDLYCGSGLFTLPLSRQFEQVVAVDSSTRGVALARANAVRNGVANARFEAADVAAFLGNARASLEPDCVLLDPPRRGAGAEVVEGIVRLAPREVRYVSCDPATLARDLAHFRDHGYELVSIVALDMFPQTPHVEAVALLCKRAASA